MRSHHHVPDAAQQALLRRLESLQNRLLRRHVGRQGLLARFRARQQGPVQGLYIWGGVGRGKTFLMDLFFESLGLAQKKRVHFHRMMQDVHTRLKALANTTDPLDRVAGDIARTTRVLCFDEFYVVDIADAMILSRLLDGLFRRGVTLVATSNSPPDGLYRDGLQRARFLPAIALLQRFTDVVHLEGGPDYRLRLLEKAGTYLTPDDDSAQEALERLFDESASSQVRQSHHLSINGRDILARQCAKGIAWFDFEEICDGPRSQDDYIEIARWYQTVIISGVPRFDADREDQARRFIALVDEFYDRRVKLVVAAAAQAERLYAGRRLAHEFARTASRLSEMQSARYLHEPHLA